MYGSNIWNHLTVFKQEQYLMVCRQISLNFVKSKLAPSYSLRNYIYNHLIVCKQMINSKQSYSY